MEDQQPRDKPSPGRFTVPSLSEIKKASKINTRPKLSLFKKSKNEASLPSQTLTSNPEIRLDGDSHVATKSTVFAEYTQGVADVEKNSKETVLNDVWSTRSTRGNSDLGLHKTGASSVPHVPEVENTTGLTEIGQTTSRAASSVTPSSVDRIINTTDESVGNKQETLVSMENTGQAGPCGAVIKKGYNPRAIVVNIVQKNNPLMKYIRNVPWELGNIVPDFELGRTTCALFLSVRYHSLHPDYIHVRLKELGKQYQLRILLVFVDTSEHQQVLQELAKIGLLADLTLILAWSPEEAARYLETYKAYENKPPDLIMERVDSDFSSRVIESLTTVKKVNKTDAATLLNNFKTMEKLIGASKDDLTLCPGLGPQKAQRLHDLFHEPFLRTKKPRLEQ